MKKQQFLPYVLLLVISAAPVMAYQITVGVFDINTLNAVSMANLTISNVTAVVAQGNTTVTGFVQVETGYGTGTQYVNLSVQKLGYITQTDELALTTDSSFLYYITPIASNGIIRLNFQDLSLGERQRYCLFYAENGRSAGCYLINDTSVLLTNHNYTLVPEITKTDMLMTKQGVSRYGRLYVPYILGGFLLVAVAAIIVFIVFRRYHR